MVCYSRKDCEADGLLKYDLVTEAELVGLVKHKEVNVIDAYLHLLYDSKVIDPQNLLVRSRQAGATGHLSDQAKSETV